MKYLLDTNVCIGILRGKQESLKQRISDNAENSLFISSIVRFELMHGVLKSANPIQNRKRLEIFLNCVETLVFDTEAANTAAKVRDELERIGMVIGPYDLLIGATALSNQCVLVTHNTREFSRIKGLKIEDWEQSLGE